MNIYVMMGIGAGVLAVLTVVDFVFDGILRFWKLRTRLGYKYLWQSFCIWRIEKRIKEQHDAQELASMIKANKEKLARLAMKNPHAFLGVERNTGAYAP